MQAEGTNATLDSILTELFLNKYLLVMDKSNDNMLFEFHILQSDSLESIDGKCCCNIIARRENPQV